MDSPRAGVFYDADCPLCVRLAERFRGWLRWQQVDLLPLQTGDASARLQIAPDNLLKEMRFLTEAGEVFGGAEAVVQIARRTWWGWPLFALSRVPGVLPVLRWLYRWIAERRNCTDGGCDRKQPYRPVAWLPLVGLLLIALGLKSVLPAWGFMWAIAFALYAGCKWLTFWEARRSGVATTTTRAIGYLLAWPGMDASTFLQTIGHPAKPGAAEWLSSLAKVLLGVVLVWIVTPIAAPISPLLTGWAGMIGLIFLLHFGMFHLLSLAWRSVGVNAPPIMRSPVLACSLAEFWGRRWNTAFHELAHRFTFRPMRRVGGTTFATLGVFFLSGLVHDLVISLPARGGFGLPTGYFFIQGLAMVGERMRLGRRIGLGRGLRGWLFTVIVIAGPVCWLFHPPFIERVILPMLHAIGAT